MAKQQFPDKIEFWVPGVPQPQPKRQVRIANGKAWTYPNDKKGSKKAWAELVRLEASKACAGYGLGYPIFGRRMPLRLTLYIYLPRTSTYGKIDQCPTAKPDRTNYLVLIENALEGIVYLNDSQICGGPPEKHFADERGPGAHIIVERILHRI
jgi:Holliday junction resolvase RusA-like endonuclease